MNIETGFPYYNLIYCSYCSSLKDQHASSGRDGGQNLVLVLLYSKMYVCMLQQPEGQMDNNSLNNSYSLRIQFCAE